MKQRLDAFCRENQREDLLDQWDREANGALRPGDLLPGSHRKVWWRCPQGHRWDAAVRSRVAGTGCPYCASRKLAPGENDLAARYPAMAAQWHPDRNGGLTPDQLLPGSRRRVWWQCGKGHAWQATPSSRTSNDNGCPVCSGKLALSGVNDLATLRPDLAAQWHPTKNRPLAPDSVTPGSNRPIWWVCGRGHVWQAVVAQRVGCGRGCPVCAGRKVLPGFNDLASQAPRVAAQWAQDQNGGLTPQMVTSGSRRKVWWRCDQDHLWQAKIYSRTGAARNGCPVCAGRLSPGPYPLSPENGQKT